MQCFANGGSGPKMCGVTELSGSLYEVKIYINIPPFQNFHHAYTSPRHSSHSIPILLFYFEEHVL